MRDRTTRSLRHRLLGGCALAALIASADPALALPQNGTVTAGSATIANTPTQTTINQSSNRAIITWRSFDTAAGETTTFNQPSSSAVALNRIPQGPATRIYGTLTGNGQIFVQNPAGVVIGPGGVVNANSFLATTANIADADFMAGNYLFTQPSTVAGAKIDNQGRVTAADKGLVAFVAPDVANSGQVTAKLGTVVMAGAQSFTIDFNGDGLTQFEIHQGTATGRVLNAGSVKADGGTVLLTAENARAMVDDVVVSTGSVEAKSIGTKGGAIILSAGSNGSASVSGSLDASGSTGNDAAGSVSVSGAAISLATSTRLSADGVGAGAGGQVSLASTTDTTLRGTISARGNSGTVAVSSTRRITTAPGTTIRSDRLLVRAQGATINQGITVNRFAGAIGSGGLTLVNATALTIDAIGNQGAIAGANGLSNAGGTIITANTGALTVAAPINASGNSITLNAANGTLRFGADVTAANATLLGASIDQTAGGLTVPGLTSVSSVGSVTLTGTNRISNFLALVVQGSLDVASSGPFAIGNTQVAPTPGAIAVSVPRGDARFTITGDLLAARPLSASGTVTLAATGAVTQTSSGSLTGRALRASGSRLDLSGSSDFATVAGGANAGDFRLVIGDTTVGTVAGSSGIVASGAVDVTSSGALTLAADVRGASARLSAARSITQNAGGIVTSSLVATATRDVLLGGANQVAALAIAAGGGARYNGTGAAATTVATIGGVAGVSGTNATLSTAGDLVLDAAVKAPVSSLTSGGALRETGNGSVIATTLVANGAGGVDLQGPNQIGTLTGGAQNNGAGFVFAQNGGLTVGQDGIGTTNGPLALILGAGDLTLSGLLNAGAGTVALALPGSLSQTAQGGIEAGALLLRARGASLTQNLSVATLAASLGAGGGSFLNQSDLTIATIATTLGVAGATGITSAGDLSVGATGALVVADAVAAAGRTVSLTSTKALTLGANLDADAISLSGGTAITQTGGRITTQSLRVDSGGDALIAGANEVANLAADISGGLRFRNANGLTIGSALGESGITAASFALAAGGPVTVSSAITTAGLTWISTPGALTLGANLGAGSLALAANSLTQTSGAVTAGSTLIRSNGAIALPGANRFGTLAAAVVDQGASITFTTVGGTTIGALADSSVDPLGTIAGASGVSSNGGAITVTAPNGITLTQPSPTLALAALRSNGGAIVIDGPTFLGSDAAVTSTGGAVTFDGTISSLLTTTPGSVPSPAANAHALAVDAGAGAVLFEGAVGRGPDGSDRSLASLAVRAGLTTFGIDAPILQTFGATASNSVNPISGVAPGDVQILGPLLALAPNFTIDIVNGAENPVEPGGNFNVPSLTANNLFLILGTGRAFTPDATLRSITVFGSGGGLDFTGAINGNFSPTAASPPNARHFAISEPNLNQINTPDGRYTFNGCAVGSTSCLVYGVLLPTITPQATDLVLRSADTDTQGDAVEYLVPIRGNRDLW